MGIIGRWSLTDECLVGRHGGGTTLCADLSVGGVGAVGIGGGVVAVVGGCRRVVVTTGRTCTCKRRKRTISG